MTKENNSWREEPKVVVEGEEMETRIFTQKEYVDKVQETVKASVLQGPEGSLESRVDAGEESAQPIVQGDIVEETPANKTELGTAMKFYFGIFCVLISGVGGVAGYTIGICSSEIDLTVAKRQVDFFKNRSSQLEQELTDAKKSLRQGRIDYTDLKKQAQKKDDLATSCSGILEKTWYRQIQTNLKKPEELDNIFVDYLNSVGGKTIWLSRNHPEDLFDRMCDGKAFGSEREYKETRTEFTDWFKKAYFNQAFKDYPDQILKFNL